MFDYLRLVRWKNLLIIGLTQLLFVLLTRTVFLALNDIALIISTILTAAAGYVINDYYDLEADKINKPNKIFISKSIRKDQSRRFYFALVTLALWVGHYALKELTSVILTINILLFLYSYKLKRWPIIGNLMVSICSAGVIFIIYIANSSSIEAFKVESKGILFFFSICALLTSMVREMVKDMEDIEGDKVAGYKTLPILAGIKTTKAIAILSLFSLLLYYFIGALEFYPKSFLPLVGFFIIVLFSSFILFKISKVNKKEDYSKLSIYCKILMLVGLGSVILWLV